MPGRSANRVFCFGKFQADEAAGELRKDGVRVKLNDQPFRALLMLLERPWSVVTREEMRRRLWGEDTFVDFDHSLNTAVNKIREALNDSASQPRYVETISGKGYRFIAPVTNRAVPEVGDHFVLPGEPTVMSGTAAAEPGKPAFAEDLQPTWLATVLATRDELPAAPRVLAKSLLLAVQAMYLAFYFGALANTQEIHELFWDAKLLPPSVLMGALVSSAAILIPVRLFIFSAVAFDVGQLRAKFNKLFPMLLVGDLLWSLSPFLLVHHVSTGLALGMSTPLIYMPFAQRSLILMYARGSASRKSDAEGRSRR
jgi:cholera toxin transcriptional activator